MLYFGLGITILALILFKYLWLKSEQFVTRTYKGKKKGEIGLLNYFWILIN